MENVSIVTAFSFGLLSFLSPCVLPMVPLYVSYILGETVGQNSPDSKKLLIFSKALGFILGFSTVFVLIQLSIGGLGELFLQNKFWVTKIGGIIIIVFGIHITGIFKFKAFLKDFKLLDISKLSKNVNSFVLGIAFAAGWTPCVDPLLGTIILYAASMDTFVKGMYLMFFYCLGLGVPFMIAALFIHSVSGFFRKIQKYLPAISVFSGIIMILMGVMLFMDKMTILYSLFGNILPKGGF